MSTPDIERVSDALTSAVLGLASAAANADMIAQLALQGVTAEADVAVRSQLNHPVTLEMLGGALSLPVLACYARQSRAKRFTFGHVDQLVSLRLHYISSATAHEQLSARWPSLSLVWQSISAAMFAGYRSDYELGAFTLCDAGVVWVQEDAACLQSFAPAGEYAFPQWEADFLVRWRPTGTAPTLYPMLGIDAQIAEYEGEAHEVRIHANTPTGDEADCATPYDEESELP